MKAHPYADKFPMLPEPELEELAESIRANGLRQPVVVTNDDLILDGRNRAAACERIGVEPETVVYEGDDLAEYVIDCNTSRRHMTLGQRAMASAQVLVADNRRDEGRWQYGDFADSQNSAGLRSYLSRAGVILDFKPDLADAVVTGEVSFDAAYREADTIRKSAERDKVLERERKKREREEAAAEAERNAQIVADLTDAGQQQYLDLIEAEQMTPRAAWAAYQEDTRKERQRQKELDDGRRSTTTRIAECVRYLDGGGEYAAIFLADFYPHEHRFVAEGMRLTRERVRSAIDFLTAIEKGIDQ